MRRLGLVFAALAVASSAWGGQFVTRTVQDGTGSHPTLYYDVSGTGVGPFLSTFVCTDGAGNICGVGGASSGSTTTATTMAAAPTFSVSAGTYTSAQTVTIASTTAGASIYYTLDGSTPTTASTSYVSPLNVAQTKTINAIAAGAGLTTSGVATSSYVINTPATAWDPTSSGSVTFSNANLTATGGAGYNALRATSGFTTGGVYWELVNNNATAYGVWFGICDNTSSGSAAFTNTFSPAKSISWRTTDAYANNNGLATAISAPSAFASVAGDRYGVLVDQSTGALFLSKNNVWFKSGVLTAGWSPVYGSTTGYSALFPQGTKIYPLSTVYGGGSVTLAPTAASQTYTPPAGFSPLG